VDWAMTQKGYQQRQACVLAGIDPRVYRRPPKRSEDADMRTRLKDLPSERRRFDYRRLHVLLRREGWQVNWKKLYRIYKEEGLTVRKRGSASVPWAPERRWQFRMDRTSAGAWTSCQTACPAAVGSGY
jgi:putative transposase